MTIPQKKDDEVSYSLRWMWAIQDRQKKAYFTHSRPISSKRRPKVSPNFLEKVKLLSNNAVKLRLSKSDTWLVNQLHSKSSMSKEDICKHIQLEFLKWNARLQVLKVGQDRDYALGMIDMLSEAKTIHCEPSEIPGESIAVFIDPNFEKEIRYYFDKDPNEPILRSEMLSLLEFGRGPGYSRKGSSSKHIYEITDLRGIEHATSLKYLSLNRRTSKTGSGIRDLQPLSGSVKLEELDVNSHKICDIKPLRKLVNLRWLDLSENPITDLEPISALIRLESLNISNLLTGNVASIGNLIKLENLTLRGNQITDLRALTKLINLRGLDLSGNQLTDLSPLSGLNNLEDLNLRSNKLIDLTPLSKLTNLESLEISDNQLTDLRPLSNLRKLKTLRLKDNLVTDLSPLAELSGLDHIDLASNRLEDLTPLTSLKGLKYLILRNNGLMDHALNALAKIDGIDHLDLSSNHFVDLTPLHGSRNLKNISISHNHVTDKSSISELTGAKVSGYTLQKKRR